MWWEGARARSYSSGQIWVRGPSHLGSRNSAFFQIHRALPPHSSGMCGALTQGPSLLFPLQVLGGKHGEPSTKHRLARWSRPNAPGTRSTPCKRSGKLSPQGCQPVGRWNVTSLFYPSTHRCYPEIHVHAPCSGWSWAALLPLPDHSGQSQVEAEWTDHRTGA